MEKRAVSKLTHQIRQQAAGGAEETHLTNEIEKTHYYLEFEQCLPLRSSSIDYDYTPLEFEITVANQRGATQAAILDVSDQSSLRLHAPVAQPVSARLAAVSSPSARSCCA